MHVSQNSDAWGSGVAGGGVSVCTGQYYCQFLEAAGHRVAQEQGSYTSKQPQDVKSCQIYTPQLGHIDQPHQDQRHFLAQHTRENININKDLTNA